MTETEQKEWAGPVNLLDVGGEGEGAKTDSKTLIHTDGLKDYAQDRNTEILLPHDPLILPFEHGGKIPHECQVEEFLGGDRAGVVTQESPKGQKGKACLCPSPEELCSAKEEEKKFELNIFLVGTTCKCSV